LPRELRGCAATVISFLTRFLHQGRKSDRNVAANVGCGALS
jgi:hypothetical protein